jgi:hypothetical protein
MFALITGKIGGPGKFGDGLQQFKFEGFKNVCLKGNYFSLAIRSPHFYE